MENFNVRTALTLADWHALGGEARTRMESAQRGKANLLTRAASVAIWLALVGICVFLFGTEPPLVRPAGIAILLVAFGGTIWLHYLLQRRSYAPMERGAFLGDHQFEFEAAGFHSRRPDSDAFNRWTLVKEITSTDQHLFLWIDLFSAYVVPVRDLPAPLTAAAAVTQLRSFMAAAAAGPSPVAEPSSDAAPSEVTPTTVAEAPIARPPSVAQELVALLSLHVWRMVEAARLYGRDITIILLGVFSFVLWAGLDRLDYEGDVEIFWYSISESGALVLAVLLPAWVLSRLSKPRIEFRRALLLVLGFLPVFVAGIWVAMRLPQAGVIVSGVLLAAAADVFFMTGMRSLTGRRQQFAVTSVLVVVFALFFLCTRFYFSPGIWYEPEPDGEKAEETRRNNEQLVFEQSSRINADISALAPRDPGKPNVFFLGFAGFGQQKVFAEEISTAATRIGDRYGSAPRTLRLINDQRDSLKYPLASVPSLRHALNAVSQRMNVDEDVLFLALSSHGSKDGAVSVSSELGYWRDLGAEDLADMLRESGIRWRVIVVSACYAGSFIEPLKNDNTIVLTASAADRTSFGCSDDNDLTYFGEAFYRDALPKASSLRAAFETARAAILERETREGIAPSNPQAWFGAELEKKLVDIEAARTN